MGHKFDKLHFFLSKENFRFLEMLFDRFDVYLLHTVKPVLSGHSKIDKTKILMTNVNLMKVESIAECSPWSILQYC